MADTVFARPIFDIVAPTELTHRIAGAQHRLDVGDDVREMMKRRAIALEEDEIVWRILHLQENTDRVTACRNVVGNTAAERRVEACGLLDVRNRDLVVIEA